MSRLKIQVSVGLGGRKFIATIPLDEIVTHGMEGLFTDKQLREEIDLCALGYVVDHIKVKSLRGEVARVLKQIKREDGS